MRSKVLLKSWMSTHGFPSGNNQALRACMPVLITTTFEKKSKAKAYSMRSFSLLQKKRYNEHTKTNKAVIFLSSLQKSKSSVLSKGYVLVSFKGYKGYKKYKEYKEYKECIPSSKVVRWFLHNFGLT